MLVDWKNFVEENAEAFKNLGKSNPELSRAVMSLPNAGSKDALDSKTKELISLAVAATTRCDGCIAFHTEGAIKAGATRQEVLETLAVAVAMNAGAATVYSSRVLEAYDQLSK